MGSNHTVPCCNYCSSSYSKAKAVEAWLKFKHRGIRPDKLHLARPLTPGRLAFHRCNQQLISRLCAYIARQPKPLRCTFDVSCLNGFLTKCSFALLAFTPNSRARNPLDRRVWLGGQETELSSIRNLVGLDQVSRLKHILISSNLASTPSHI